MHIRNAPDKQRITATNSCKLSDPPDFVFYAYLMKKAHPRTIDAKISAIATVKAPGLKDEGGTISKSSAHSQCQQSNAEKGGQMKATQMCLLSEKPRILAVCKTTDSLCANLHALPAHVHLQRSSVMMQSPTIMALGNTAGPKSFSTEAVSASMACSSKCWRRFSFICIMLQHQHTRIETKAGVSSAALPIALYHSKILRRKCHV